jgi:putative restriction endonuclease
MAHRDWTKEELVVAFNLYCKIPFGKIHTRNPQVIELAKAIHRTPSAVSWKLANFARLDPALKKRHIVGATHGSQAEIEVWSEFNDSWERLAYESEQLLVKMTGRPTDILLEAERFPEGKNRATLVQTRVNQGFFRAAVLAAYGLRCCITGLSIPELLTASHIVPWSKDKDNRTNPRNGLCLSAVHDRAFDCGLLTVTPDFKVRLSSRIKKKSSDLAARELLQRYDGAQVTLPERFAPSESFLRYHNENVFIDGRTR